MHRYVRLGHDLGPVFSLLLKYAVSEDGGTARREVLSNGPRGIHFDPPRLPLAAARRAGPRDRQRMRPPRAGRRPGPGAAQGLSRRPDGAGQVRPRYPFFKSIRRSRPDESHQEFRADAAHPPRKPLLQPSRCRPPVGPGAVGYAGRPDVLVLALPRGGVPVAYEIALALDAPLDVLLVRKLGVPGREELALGALAAGGFRFLNEEVVRRLHVPPHVIDAVTAAVRKELLGRKGLSGQLAAT